MYFPISLRFQKQTTVGLPFLDCYFSKHSLSRVYTFLCVHVSCECSSSNPRVGPAGLRHGDSGLPLRFPCCGDSFPGQSSESHWPWVLPRHMRERCTRKLPDSPELLLGSRMADHRGGNMMAMPPLQSLRDLELPLDSCQATRKQRHGLKDSRLRRGRRAAAAGWVWEADRSQPCPPPTQHKAKSGSISSNYARCEPGFILFSHPYFPFVPISSGVYLILWYCGCFVSQLKSFLEQSRANKLNGHNL